MLLPQPSGSRRSCLQHAGIILPFYLLLHGLASLGVDLVRGKTRETVVLVSLQNLAAAAHVVHPTVDVFARTLPHSIFGHGDGVLHGSI